MVSSHTAEVAPAPSPKMATKPARGGSRWYIPAIVFVIVAVAGVGWWALRGHGTTQGAVPQEESAAVQEPSSEESTHVEVVHPRPGGVKKMSAQPGTVNAFEYADLEAKISGYLQEQSVDIGDRVKKGQLLAVIEDPEAHKEVDRAAAQLELSKAQVAQADARIKSAMASREAVSAQVTQAEAEVARWTAEREFRAARYGRYSRLYTQKVIDLEAVDEEKDHLEVARAAENSSKAAVLTAKAQLLEADAKIEQAKADLFAAQANVDVDQANLAKAKVLAEYTRITSSYDGVVTKREYHVGEFIRSSADGGSKPLLRVARTDLMRIVVQVPDSDVPFLDKGDPAVLKIKTLGGAEFKGSVSRMSYQEDVETRTMRVEIDVPNKDGRLREGMYGLVTILLQPASKDPNTVMIPASCLIGEEQEGKATVYVIRDGKAHKLPIATGADNGVDVEVLSGLTPTDEVALPTSGYLAEGQPVIAEQAQQEKKTGK